MTAQLVSSYDPVVLNGNAADPADKLFKKTSDKRTGEREVSCDNGKRRH